jgi:hypothetical protein
MCRMSWNLGAWNSWKTQGLFRPVMGLLYLYFYPVRYFCESSYQRFGILCFVVGSKTFTITLIYSLRKCLLLTVDVPQVFTVHFIFMDLWLIYIPINSHPINSKIIIWVTVMVSWNIRSLSDKKHKTAISEAHSTYIFRQQACEEIHVVMVLSEHCSHTLLPGYECPSTSIIWWKS